MPLTPRQEREEGSRLRGVAAPPERTSLNVPYDVCLELAGCSTPERVVDFVDNVRCTDRSVVETASVKTLEGFLTSRDRVELDVDIALCVGVNSNVHNFAVLLVALDPDFGLEVLYPVVAPGLLFSELKSAGARPKHNTRETLTRQHQKRSRS
jgi:hypothetical protein